MRMKTFKFSDYELSKGQKRMLRLAKMVEAIHPKQFDMDTVICSRGSGCGSTGCVIGWAAATNMFPGLVYRKVTRKEANEDDSPFSSWDIGSALAILNGKPVDFGNDEGLQELLDLNSSEDVADLFGGGDSSTPLTKATQIRQYVQNQLLA